MGVLLKDEITPELLADGAVRDAKQRKRDSERLREEDKSHRDDQPGSPMPFEDLCGCFVWVEPEINSEAVRSRVGELGLNVTETRAAARVFQLGVEFVLPFGLALVCSCNAHSYCVSSAISFKSNPNSQIHRNSIRGCKMDTMVQLRI